MKINLSIAVFLIYVSFALDSLLKINIGFKIHVGILLILILNVFLLPRRSFWLSSFFDKNIMFALVFLVVSAIFTRSEGTFVVLFYFFIAVNIAVFINGNLDKFSERGYYWFQIFIVVTGFSQYALLKIFGYQLSFIDSEHYSKGYSVANRLRGFFVEPNWYAISIAFNTILLIGDDIKSAYQKYKYLLIFSFVVMILNGTLATLGVLLCIYMYPVFKENIIRGVVILFLCLSVGFAALSYRESVSVTGDLAFNYNSRLLPLERVIDYQQEGSLFNLIFGNGLGTWGTIGVSNNLSVLVHEEKPDARDGSELPVILFELGWIGVFLILFDSLVLLLKANLRSYHLSGAILLFLSCLCFYPIYKFLMYMPYYFIIRSLILRKNYYGVRWFETNSNLSSYK